MPKNQNVVPPTHPHAVTVTYDASAGYWTMDTGNGPTNPPNYPGLVVPYNHKGEITYRIKDTPGVSFADPAFVQKRGQPDPGDFAAQFTSKTKGNGKILVVHDENTSPNGQPHQKDYHYELKFSDGSTLDPIITNMGCCQRAEANYLVPLAIGAAALLAVYFFIVRPWLVRRSGGPRPNTGAGGGGSSTKPHDKGPDSL
jgi:hypothetical protein